jgi:signal transduction histidine kinase
VLAGYTTTVEFERFAREGGFGFNGGLTHDLAEYYLEHGSWDGVGDLLPRGRGRMHGGPHVVLVAPAGNVIADPSNVIAGGEIDPQTLASGYPIHASGQHVGTLITTGPPGNALLSIDQQAFLQRMRTMLTISGAAALLVALVIGAVLARGIARPLRQLTAASRSIAAGDLDVRVPVRSEDEVGQLAAAFNHMAADLARAEEARRQQTADIAHELRTPLTVIQGHLEALADGIFPSDMEHIEPVLEQSRLLGRLVQDLRTLSLADAGRLALTPVPTDVADWASRVVAGFRSIAAEQNVMLTLDLTDSLPPAEIDPERMAQVLSNLLDNALRHTPSGGRISVRIGTTDDFVAVTVTDTGPGAPPDQLSRLFQRFWRGDPSRSRQTGGSGLGLAIARRIVEEHGGQIQAENAPDAGLCIRFTLPVA